MNKSELLIHIAEKLKSEYGTPDLGNKRDPMDELVFISLCTKTGPRNVQRAYHNLRSSFGSWEEVLQSQDGEVSRVIAVAGLAHEREVRLKEMLTQIMAEQGELRLDSLRQMNDQDAFNLLSSLPGVGTKIAHCVMLFSLDRSVLPVDTHISRILRRLAIVESSRKADDIALEIQQIIPKGLARILHVNMIVHGRNICRADSPKCERCCISNLCAYAGAHVLLV